jgi:hypothetical protein
MQGKMTEYMLAPYRKVLEHTVPLSAEQQFENK